MRKLHKFPGGIRLDGRREMSNSRHILPVEIPEYLVFPLGAHIGMAAIPVVNMGDQVLKGQLIAIPDGYVSSAIHASSSGVVVDIADHPMVSGNAEKSILIQTDGRDLWGEKMNPLDYTKTDPEILEQRIADAGIIGLGGAGFPSQVKVMEGADRIVETLIINGVECEPYITCDDRLIRERVSEVIVGAKILQKIVAAKECIIVVEDDMPEARDALQSAAFDGQEIVSVPAIYPAGGEKQLILTITGKHVPSHNLPIKVGVLVHNVATVTAIYRAVTSGEPLISRIVTVTGEGIEQAENVEVLIGTPVADLLSRFNKLSGRCGSLVMGGAMMGLPVMSVQAPVTGKTSCLLLKPATIKPHALPCIRCGNCLEVCPMSLQPQLLYSLAKHQQWDELQGHRLFDCIECACCDVVCPSHIPLVSYFQQAKSAIQHQDETRARAEMSRGRYHARNERLQRQQDQQNAGERASPVADRKILQSEILAAIQRSQSKRKTNIRKSDPDVNQNDQ